MPLQHSPSKTAFRRNVAAEIAAGKPRDQALAIAYSVKRKARAMGGRNLPMGSGVHEGPIASAVPGRTDNHPMDVASGSYVLPADHVSSLGQGNTAAGMAVLDQMFSKMGGAAGSSKKMLGLTRPSGAKKRFADGGETQDSFGEAVPINAAGGEYVIPPEIVLAIGGGDMKHGHAVLDDWVVKNRKQHVKTLSKLPGPAKS